MPFPISFNVAELYVLFNSPSIALKSVYALSIFDLSGLVIIVFIKLNISSAICWRSFSGNISFWICSAIAYFRLKGFINLGWMPKKLLVEMAATRTLLTNRWRRLPVFFFSTIKFYRLRYLLNIVSFCVLQSILTIVKAKGAVCYLRKSFIF